MEREISGIILCGGEYSRMGKNKAFLEVRGEKIIERTLRIFKGIFKEVMIVVKNPLPYSGLDVRIVSDLFPYSNPLVGIYTGLFFSSYHHSFVSACDMPFLNPELIELLISRAENYDVVVPRSKDGLQPLHAVYSKRCLKPIEKTLKEETSSRIMDFYPLVKVAEIGEEDILPLDRGLLSFFNLNTLQDLESMEELQKGND